MNVIFVTIDSLSKHFLKVYGRGARLEVRTPNLDALAEKSLVFDRHYAGSLPCMPARREFLTGIQEFLWRTWGPLEPFDQPIARLARMGGRLTQLVTDHFHYFQHGSHGYYEDYHGWELIRGHEYDAWKTHPRELDPTRLRQVSLDAKQAESLWFLNRAQYLRNVLDFKKEADFFAPKVFSRAADWLEQNAKAYDGWFLYIDSFEVHEPFHVPEPYRSMYTDEDPGDPALVYWPVFGDIQAGPSALSNRQLAFVRAQYAGKLTMVDRWLGRLLERLDDFDLWSNTMVVVTTDHGHYLGEHGWIGKPNCPVYNTLAHTPLLIRHPEAVPGRVEALTSAVDLYATILEALELPVPEHVHSRSLLPLVQGGRAHPRDWVLYGYWGKGVNIADGRHTYLRAPARDNSPLYNYSTMMMNPTSWFYPPRLQEEAEAGRYLPYAAGPCWRYPLAELPGAPERQLAFADPAATTDPGQREHLLFDIQNDPDQLVNLAKTQPELEGTMIALLRRALGELQAPEEQYERLGL
jgi:arylsulfatase A-like enzyme